MLQFGIPNSFPEVRMMYRSNDGQGSGVGVSRLSDGLRIMMCVVCHGVVLLFGVEGMGNSLYGCSI